MAERKVIDCDGCPQTALKEYGTISAVIDRRTDAAGSVEDITKEIDLCVSCLTKQLQKLVGCLKYTESQNWIKRVGRK